MHTVTSRDGTGIAFDRFGEGPAVILVGGALQHRAFDTSTAELAGILAERFSVFNYDRRVAATPLIRRPTRSSASSRTSTR
jgi:hypothetical protein